MLSLVPTDVWIDMIKGGDSIKQREKLGRRNEEKLERGAIIELFLHSLAMAWFNKNMNSYWEL